MSLKMNTRVSDWCYVREAGVEALPDIGRRPLEEALPTVCSTDHMTTLANSKPGFEAAYVFRGMEKVPQSCLRLHYCGQPYPSM